MNFKQSAQLATDLDVYSHNLFNDNNNNNEIYGA